MSHTDLSQDSRGPLCGDREKVFLASDDFLDLLGKAREETVDPALKEHSKEGIPRGKPSPAQPSATTCTLSALFRRGGFFIPKSWGIRV